MQIQKTNSKVRCRQMDIKEYTLSEISERSGFPAQTIQYFVEQRLLIKPISRGYYTMYEQSFMNRLLLIRRMQENQLGINEIRQRLTNLADDQVNEMLALDEQSFNDRYQSSVKPQTPVPGSELQDEVAGSSETQDFDPNPQSRLQASRWQRVEIMPGIEINIQERLLHTYRENIQDAVAEFIKALNNSK